MSVKYETKFRKREAIQAVDNAKKKALTSAALLVHGDANLLAPVDTGNLRASLNYEVSNDFALVGTPVEYAPYVEMGTSRMSAQPYLRPALDNRIRDITKLISNILDQDLRGVGK